MRVACEVRVCNRVVSSQQASKKSLKGVVILGLPSEHSGTRKPKPQIRVYTLKDRKGTGYGACGNVVKVFSNFVDEGKCTVQLSDPSIDIFIQKANPVQLKAFLKMLDKAARGDVGGSDGDKLQLTNNLRPMKRSSLLKRTKLTVLARSQYPALEGFPAMLEELTIKGLKLMKIESRILALRHLRSLDISNNDLSQLPDMPGGGLPCLVELNLSSNHLTKLNPKFFSGDLCSKLVSLNLFKNQLTEVDAVQPLRALVSLNVSSNKLVRLPPRMDLLARLRNLNLSGNPVTSLPASAAGCQLFNGGELNIHNCPILGATEERRVVVKSLDRQPFPSLVHLAARAVIRHGLEYHGPEDLPADLVRLLDEECSGVCAVCRVEVYGPHQRTLEYKSFPFLDIIFSSENRLPDFDSGMQQCIPLDVVRCPMCAHPRYNDISYQL